MMARTNNGKKGGELKGQAHSECDEDGCGIPAIVTDANNKPVELEGDELIVNKKSAQDPREFTITGTPKEIVSAVNSMDGNGVVIDEGAVVKNHETGEVTRFEDGGKVTPTFSRMDALKMAGGGSASKRKSPTMGASLTPVGTILVSDNNGENYIVSTDKNGVHRWKKTSASIVNIDITKTAYKDPSENLSSTLIWVEGLSNKDKSQIINAFYSLGYRFRGKSHTNLADINLLMFLNYTNVIIDYVGKVGKEEWLEQQLLMADNKETSWIIPADLIWTDIGKVDYPSKGTTFHRTVSSVSPTASSTPSGFDDNGQIWIGNMTTEAKRFLVSCLSFLGFNVPDSLIEALTGLMSTTTAIRWGNDGNLLYGAEDIVEFDKLQAIGSYTRVTADSVMKRALDVDKPIINLWGGTPYNSFGGLDLTKTLKIWVGDLDKKTINNLKTLLANAGIKMDARLSKIDMDTSVFFIEHDVLMDGAYLLTASLNKDDFDARTEVEEQATEALKSLPKLINNKQNSPKPSSQPSVELDLSKNQKIWIGDKQESFKAKLEMALVDADLDFQQHVDIDMSNALTIKNGKVNRIRTKGKEFEMLLDDDFKPLEKVDAEEALKKLKSSPSSPLFDPSKTQGIWVGNLSNAQKKSIIQSLINAGLVLRKSAQRIINGMSPTSINDITAIKWNSLRKGQVFLLQQYNLESDFLDSNKHLEVVTFDDIMQYAPTIKRPSSFSPTKKQGVWVEDLGRVGKKALVEGLIRTGLKLGSQSKDVFDGTSAVSFADISAITWNLITNSRINLAVEQSKRKFTQDMSKMDVEILDVDDVMDATVVQKTQRGKKSSASQAPVKIDWSKQIKIWVGDIKTAREKRKFLNFISQESKIPLSNQILEALPYDDLVDGILAISVNYLEGNTIHPISRNLYDDDDGVRKYHSDDIDIGATSTSQSTPPNFPDKWVLWIGDGNDSTDTVRTKDYQRKIRDRLARLNANVGSAKSFNDELDTFSSFPTYWKGDTKGIGSAVTSRATKAEMQWEISKGYTEITLADIGLDSKGNLLGTSFKKNQSAGTANAFLTGIDWEKNNYKIDLQTADDNTTQQTLEALELASGFSIINSNISLDRTEFIFTDNFTNTIRIGGTRANFDKSKNIEINPIELIEAVANTPKSSFKPSAPSAVRF